MLKLTALCSAAVLVLAGALQAAEGHARASVGMSYSPHANHFVEGTVSNVDKGGHVAIRGAVNPYSSNYYSYHRDYYGFPEAERERHRGELRDRYSDGLSYSWNGQNLQDYSFDVPVTNDFAIYDDPNYGASYDTWSFSNEPRTYAYSDLQVGDHVVVGYDSNGNRVYSMHKVNPRSDTRTRTENTTATRPATTPETPRYNRENPANGHTNSIERNSVTPDGTHVMNLPSNATNDTSGAAKNGSSSGHIMNTGSNNTNPGNPNTLGR